MGLLEPAAVNPDTGYRYYSPARSRPPMDELPKGPSGKILKTALRDA